MDRPLLSRLGDRRRVVLGALSAASLLAALALAPADLARHASVLRDAAAGWVWQTRWAWPLAATVAFAVLTSQRVRRRWPQPSRRLGVGVAGAVGMIGLVGFTVTAGPGTVLLIVGGAVLLGLLATWVLLVPTWLAPPLPAAVLDRLSDSERLEKADACLKLQNDLRTTALQAIAGLAVLAGAVLAFQQLTEDRHQAAADRELTRQGQASQRFTRAISQLGSDRREVQLGGIYGLEQIAQQAPDNRLVVAEVLASYLRRRAPRPAKLPTEQVPEELQVRAPDVHAALTVLGRRVPSPDDPRLNLRDLDLSSALLSPRPNLSKADLSRTWLRWAHLPGVNFIDASLAEADLSSSYLFDANFSGADLYGANLSGASLTRAEISGNDIAHADLSALIHRCGDVLRLFGV